MGRKAAKTAGEGGPTVPRQFRLGDDTLADLDLIAGVYTVENRKKQSRADAIRIAAKQLADKLRKKQAEDTK